MNILEPGELLTAVRMPKEWSGGTLLLREGCRPAVLGLCAGERRRGDVHRGRLYPPRAPRVRGRGGVPHRLREVEEIIAGQRQDPNIAELAGRSAIHGAQPVALNAFKVPLMESLVRRAVREA